jgi:hypothetical protein
MSSINDYIEIACHPTASLSLAAYEVSQLDLPSLGTAFFVARELFSRGICVLAMPVGIIELCFKAAIEAFIKLSNATIMIQDRTFVLLKINKPKEYIVIKPFDFTEYSREYSSRSPLGVLLTVFFFGILYSPKVIKDMFNNNHNFFVEYSPPILIEVEPILDPMQVSKISARADIIQEKHQDDIIDLQTRLVRLINVPVAICSIINELCIEVLKISKLPFAEDSKKAFLSLVETHVRLSNAAYFLNQSVLQVILNN